MWQILGIFASFAPLLLIFWLANLGQRLRERGVPHMTPVVVSYTLVGFLYGFCILGGLAMLFVDTALKMQPETAAIFANMDPNPLEQITSWPWLIWGTLIPSIFGLVFLTRPARRFAARLIDIDPGHPVHAVALSLTMAPLVMMGMTVGIGLGTMTAGLEQQVQETGMPPVSLAALWAQTGVFVLIALVGVGWLSRRSLGQSLVRLGIVKPKLREVLIGIGLAFALVAAVMVVSAIAGAMGMGEDQEVSELTETLLGTLLSSPLGILSIGLAAAIGEEPLFRGAAQPRFGLLVTSVLFALVHNNYGLSFATVIVFGLGLVLGLIRIRYNTTTSMITHAVYNSTLVTVSMVAVSIAQNAAK